MDSLHEVRVAVGKPAGGEHAEECTAAQSFEEPRVLAYAEGGQLGEARPRRARHLDQRAKQAPARSAQPAVTAASASRALCHACANARPPAEARNTRTDGSSAPHLANPAPKASCLTESISDATRASPAPPERTRRLDAADAAVGGGLRALDEGRGSRSRRREARRAPAGRRSNGINGTDTAAAAQPPPAAAGSCVRHSQLGTR